jgi:predicted secreted hydrolase
MALRALFLLLVTAALASGAEGWRLALPGWHYEFPRDHHPHAGFKTEWWYFTGNVRDASGRRFGYQVTFFRQGIRPPGARGDTASALIVHELPFAHFAVSDVASGRFHFGQRINRGAFGQAGFGDGERVAWVEDWTLRLDSHERFHVEAKDGSHALALTLSSVKPWAIHGENGVSQKAAGEGRASHYYSGTRLATQGTLTVDGKQFAVSGESWFDHEWATNQLTPEQAGWDWFSIQLHDGTELMLYQLRLRAGGSDPQSSGTFVGRDGRTRHLRRDDYTLTPVEFWKSPANGARYPVAWEIAVPRLDLQLRVSTPLPAQELALEAIAYWEGAIDVEGTRAGQPVRGQGYMELTGYAGPLSILSGARQ